MKTKLLAAIPFLALLSPLAHAAETVTLTLSGQIAPVACTLTVANGGAFAFGNLETDSLNSSGKTLIGTLQQPYSVSCPGGARVELKVVDNKTGTASDVAGTVGTTHFGVGLDASSNKIGYSNYELAASPQINGAAGSYLSSVDSGATWTPVTGLYTLDHLATASVSFTTSGGSAPVFVETASGNVNGILYIDDKSGLDLTQQFNVDGSATMELVYL